MTVVQASVPGTACTFQYVLGPTIRLRLTPARGAVTFAHGEAVRRDSSFSLLPGHGSPLFARVGSAMARRDAVGMSLTRTLSTAGICVFARLSWARRPGTLQGRERYGSEDSRHAGRFFGIVPEEDDLPEMGRSKPSRHLKLCTYGDVESYSGLYRTFGDGMLWRAPVSGGGDLTKHIPEVGERERIALRTRG